MASNHSPWVRNLFGYQEPLEGLGKFQAGATQAVKRGELLELTGAGTTFVPIDSDFDMTGGDIAVAACEIKSGDRAGYYPILIPRPGDVWEFKLAAAGASAVGTALYFSDSETVTATVGTNILGHVAGFNNYPLQGFASEDVSPDAGSTIRSVSRVRMTVRYNNSFGSRLQKLS